MTTTQRQPHTVTLIGSAGDKLAFTATRDFRRWLRSSRVRLAGRVHKGIRSGSAVEPRGRFPGEP